jgi:hypothetical protein
MRRIGLAVLKGANPPSSLLIFFHGGYWQMNDKEPYTFLGEGVLSAGFSLVMIEYTLAPSARIDQIVGVARRAVAWVINMKTAKALGLTIPSLPLRADQKRSSFSGQIRLTGPASTLRSRLLVQGSGTEGRVCMSSRSSRRSRFDQTNRMEDCLRFRSCR